MYVYIISLCNDIDSKRLKQPPVYVKSTTLLRSLPLATNKDTSAREIEKNLEKSLCRALRRMPVTPRVIHVRVSSLETYTAQCILTHVLNVLYRRLTH